MADVIHRTNRVNGELEQRFSKNTAIYSVVTWIINPDLSSVIGIARIYWKIVVDAVVEMTAGEKTAVDAAILVVRNAATESLIKSRLNLPLPLDGISSTVVVSGLVITIDISTIVVSDQTTVVADPSLTKFVKVCYVYDSVLDTFLIDVFEKTDGLYAEFGDDEQLAADFGEWSVVANGTDLDPV